MPLIIQRYLESHYKLGWKMYLSQLSGFFCDGGIPSVLLYSWEKAVRLKDDSLGNLGGNGYTRLACGATPSRGVRE